VIITPAPTPTPTPTPTGPAHCDTCFGLPDHCRSSRPDRCRHGHRSDRHLARLQPAQRASTVRSQLTKIPGLLYQLPGRVDVGTDGGADGLGDRDTNVVLTIDEPA
jgi:hypothetical protein